MARAYHLSDEERRKRSERMKRLHADPEFAAKLNSPRQRAAASERMKRLHAERILKRSGLKFS